MIVYPVDWEVDYEELAYSCDVHDFIGSLYAVLVQLNVNHLAYSGGIDSTIILRVMAMRFENIHTYTISSRKDHPDILFARMGSDLYHTHHHEFIVEPTHKETDVFGGDNAVRQLFEETSKFTDKIICCDGIDEFMCGYYDHQTDTESKYKYYLSRLLPDHLTPLNSASGDMKVYLPYLDPELVNFYKGIPLNKKVDAVSRKKIMVEAAKILGVPDEIINRNKYGFVDAFLEQNKPTLE